MYLASSEPTSLIAAASSLNRKGSVVQGASKAASNKSRRQQVALPNPSSIVPPPALKLPEAEVACHDDFWNLKMRVDQAKSQTVRRVEHPEKAVVTEGTNMRHSYPPQEWYPDILTLFRCLSNLLSSSRTPSGSPGSPCASLQPSLV